MNEWDVASHHQGKKGGSVKRILVYTHNSIGLGHAFRTLAVITGMKKWRPDIDFLVISGTSIPQIFFREGIEVIKLPSIKLDIDRSDNRMICRYFTGVELEEIFDFRQRIILESFAFFQPDVFIVEHNMTGQMSELIPVLMKKWMRRGGPADFCLVHICRGIMRWIPLLQIPYQNPRHRSESINIGSLYDFMYVLEDRDVIDINKAFLGNDRDLEQKIRYLGKITNKTFDEIPPRKEVIERFGLGEKGIVVVTLGRNSRVPELSLRLLAIFEHSGIKHSHEIVFLLDPYLAREHQNTLRNHPLSKGVRIRQFVPNLVDLIRYADLVVSRAGYNIVNEILLTGARAVLIPESHGGGEQEMRARSINETRIRVFTEDELLEERAESLIADLLNTQFEPGGYRFDKYAIGKRIVEEVEGWNLAKGNR